MMKKLGLILSVFLFLSVQLSAQSVGYIENKGQWDNEIVAKYSLANGVVWFKKDRVIIPIIEENAFVEAVEMAHEHEGEEHIIVQGMPTQCALVRIPILRLIFQESIAIM